MLLDEFLQTLVRDLRIDPDLTVQLAGYEESSAAEAIVERLQSSDRALQSKFLADRLEEYLMDIFFRQVERPLTISEVEIEPETKIKVFANNSAGSLDSEFYTNLEQANSGRGYYESDWKVEGFAPDGWVLVVKDNLHLQTPPTHIYPPPGKLKTGDLAAILMPKNLLTVDRYIAISDRGRLQDRPVVHCYFNCPATVVSTLVAALCRVLNQAELVFELAVEISEENYERIEPVVLRLEQASFVQAQPLLQEVYREMGGQLRSATPLFTQAVAPGVGIAKGDDLDFGIRLWGAVARGCATSWHLELIEVKEQLAVIRSELLAANIDLQRLEAIGDRQQYDRWA